MAKKTIKKSTSKSNKARRVRTLSLKTKPKVVNEKLKSLIFIFGFIGGLLLNLFLFSYPIPLFLTSLSAKFDKLWFISLIMVLIFALEIFIPFLFFKKRKYLALGIWLSVILFLLSFGLLVLSCRFEFIGFCSYNVLTATGSI